MEVSFGEPGLEDKVGEFISEDAAIFVNLVHSIVELAGDRFGSPDVGTTWIHSTDYNVSEAIPHADTQGYIGASRVMSNVDLVETTVPDIYDRNNLRTDVYTSGKRFTIEV